ncbi:hypothetical protein NC651_036943 [Populus alba x Populus x berolinensis]|nr:hypothetical protein NC651_036943 [Populus alba x Populus x berolinensis]
MPNMAEFYSILKQNQQIHFRVLDLMAQWRFALCLIDILSTLFIFFFFPVYMKRLEPETSLEDVNAS